MAHDACLFVIMYEAFGLLAVILISTVIIYCFYTSLYRGTSSCLVMSVMYLCIMHNVVMSRDQLHRRGARPDAIGQSTAGNTALQGWALFGALGTG